MSQFIQQAVKDITISTKFLQLETGGVSLEIDMQGLMLADTLSEDAWINITSILKAYNVRFRDWIRNKNVQEYINERTSRFLTGAKLRGLKIPFTKGQWYKKSKFNWLDQDTPLICARSGRYHSGTWIHKTLFLKLIMVLDVKIEVTLHEAIEDVIRQSAIVKIERTGTKTLFHELTDTIKNIYIPAQNSDNSKNFAYVNLMNLANKFVLGCSARKYCELHDIEITKDMISVRDALPENLLNEIEKAEKHINGLILYGMITDYNELALELEKMK